MEKYLEKKLNKETNKIWCIDYIINEGLRLKISRVFQLCLYAAVADFTL